MKSARRFPRVLATLAGAIGLAGVLTTGGPARAVPMPFGGNYYEYVSNVGVSWAGADTAAAGMSHLSVSGPLATVTSAAENAFLAGLVSGFEGFAGAWLGGEVTSSGSGGTGTWIVGPEAGQDFSVGGSAILGAYANWGGIEPNNAPSKVYMNVGALFSGIANGQWADSFDGLSRAGDPIQGYFVEYETNAVPLPAALPLFATGLGLLGLAGLRRKRRGATVKV